MVVKEKIDIAINGISDVPSSLYLFLLTFLYHLSFHSTRTDKKEVEEWH